MKSSKQITTIDANLAEFEIDFIREHLPKDSEMARYFSTLKVLLNEKSASNIKRFLEWLYIYKLPEIDSDGSHCFVSVDTGVEPQPFVRMCKDAIENKRCAWRHLTSFDAKWTAEELCNGAKGKKPAVKRGFGETARKRLKELENHKLSDAKRCELLKHLGDGIEKCLEDLLRLEAAWYVDGIHYFFVSDVDFKHKEVTILETDEYNEGEIHTLRMSLEKFISWAVN
jgi:hypothetical protein